MTTRIDADAVTADHGLESKHRALWALGDYTTWQPKWCHRWVRYWCRPVESARVTACSTSPPGRGMWRYPPR